RRAPRGAEEVRAAGGAQAVPVLQALRRTPRAGAAYGVAAGVLVARSLRRTFEYASVRSLLRCRPRRSSAASAATVSRSWLRLPFSATAGGGRRHDVGCAGGVRAALPPIREAVRGRRAASLCDPRRSGAAAAAGSVRLGDGRKVVC